jgi:hypothetical protein
VVVSTWSVKPAQVYRVIQSGVLANALSSIVVCIHVHAFRQGKGMPNEHKQAVCYVTKYPEGVSQKYVNYDQLLRLS